MASPPLPLAGRRIAITRAGGPDDALARALVELGAEVLDAPSIVLADPPSWDELDGALRGIDTIAWIVFASATAVERLVARAGLLDLAITALCRPRLAAVGQATARRVSALLRAPDLVPSEATGAALAEALGPRVRGERVLVPRAADGRPELMEGLVRAGAEVVAPIAYRTLPAPVEALAPLSRALSSGSVDAVLFASPSAVRSVVAALGPVADRLRAVTLAAIGPTTAAQLRALDLPVHVQPSVATAGEFARAVGDRLGPASAGKSALREP